MSHRWWSESAAAGGAPNRSPSAAGRLASCWSTVSHAESRHLVDELASGPTAIEVAEIADTEPSAIAPVLVTWWLHR